MFTHKAHKIGNVLHVKWFDVRGAIFDNKFGQHSRKAQDRKFRLRAKNNGWTGFWPIFSRARKTFLIGCLGAMFALIATAAHGQSRAEIAFVTEFFNQLQPKSIAANREFCGYFGRDAQGNFVATKPTRGREGSCAAYEPPLNLEIFASYHTHGGFSYDFDSEVPSSDDLQADIAEETNGYIATPGGRIWFNDANNERAVMLCGRNCTVSDSDYDSEATSPLRNRYTLDQLYRRENE